MIKAKYIKETDSKPITELTINGDVDTIMHEFTAIIKGICKNPCLVRHAISVVDDMIASQDDYIEQLKKEMNGLD